MGGVEVIVGEKVADVGVVDAASRVRTYGAGLRPPSASMGSENAGASTTSAPAIPNDLRASSWAHTPP